MDVRFGQVIGAPAMLEQAAEECTEMAQACLKLARIMRGENPTPMTRKEAEENLAEEVADVCICADELFAMEVIREDRVNRYWKDKQERAKERIRVKMEGYME